MATASDPGTDATIALADDSSARNSPIPPLCLAWASPHGITEDESDNETVLEFLEPSSKPSRWDASDITKFSR